MGEIITFITVDNCVEAIEFYKEVFHAFVVGEMTMLENIPGMEEHKGKVGHSTIQIGESRFFMNDALEEFPMTVGERIQLVLDMETEDELRTAFEKLVKEGELIVELQEVHWGALFGTVKDKFGVTWQLYYGHK
jgi:PhnB protein